MASTEEHHTDSKLTFSQIQQGIREATLRIVPRAISHCCQNAYLHLERAWVLLGLDAEMSAFRSITAEEESATALILALKHRRYPGANRLNHRNHSHKAAFTPLVDGIQKALSTLDQLGKPTAFLNKESNPPSIKVQIDVSGLFGEPAFAQPDEPLNFLLSHAAITDTGVEKAAKPHLFETELNELAKSSGKGTILDHIQTEANFRNELLYAKVDGIPQIKLKKGFILERLRRVTLLHSLTIIILQTPKQQLFAIQCLESLLKALDRQPSDPFLYPTECASQEFGVEVTLRLDQEPVIRYSRNGIFQEEDHGTVTPIFVTLDDE